MKYIIPLLAFVLMLSGCSNKYALKQSTIDEYNLSFEDINGIQFYNSHDIVLTNYEAVKSDKSTSKGNLNVNFDKQVDQVIVKANTKGRIIQDLGDNKYAVSFESDNSKQLVFGRSSKGDVFHLQAIEWKNGRGKVQYDEKTYFTQSGADACSLRFNLNRRFKERRDTRVAKGNKVK